MEFDENGNGKVMEIRMHVGEGKGGTQQKPSARGSAVYPRRSLVRLYVFLRSGLLYATNVRIVFRIMYTSILIRLLILNEVFEWCVVRCGFKMLKDMCVERD